MPKTNDEREIQRIRNSLEAAEGWHSINIPPLRFPAGWEVRLVLPFAGAMARFLATNTHGGKVSIYYDTLDRLGAVGRPYWEMYVIGGGTLADSTDVTRFLAGEEEQLIEAIGQVGDPVRGAIAGLTGEGLEE